MSVIKTRAFDGSILGKETRKGNCTLQSEMMTTIFREKTCANNMHVHDTGMSSSNYESQLKTVRNCGFL